MWEIEVIFFNKGWQFISAEQELIENPNVKYGPAHDRYAAIVIQNKPSLTNCIIVLRDENRSIVKSERVQI